MGSRRIRGPMIVDNTTVFTGTGNFTMANEAVLVVLKGTGAATTVTLPPSPVAGQWVTVKDGKGDAATNNITVQGAAAATIDGAASYVISKNYGSLLVAWNGTEWGIHEKANALSPTESGFLSGVTAGTAAASKALVLDASSNIATINSETVTSLTASNLTFGDVASINAAGSVIGNATAIANSVVIVAGADDAKGVQLPVAAAGKTVLVYSSQATNGLKIYPQVNSTINGGSANAAINIEGKTLAIFLGTSATNWASIFTVNT